MTEKRVFVPAQTVSAILARSLFDGRPASHARSVPTVALTTEHTMFHNVCQPGGFLRTTMITIGYRVYVVSADIGKPLDLAKMPRRNCQDTGQ